MLLALLASPGGGCFTKQSPAFSRKAFLVAGTDEISNFELLKGLDEVVDYLTTFLKV